MKFFAFIVLALALFAAFAQVRMLWEVFSFFFSISLKYADCPRGLAGRNWQAAAVDVH